MLFQFHINLTEDDYFAFNYFHALESSGGNKLVRRSRTLCILITAFLSILLLFYIGFNLYYLAYLVFILPFTALYMIFYKKIIARNMKAQIKRLKKTGKLPFAPASTIEFYEDKMVEVSPSSRTEQGYNIFERICIISDRYLYLYKSSLTAYILPIEQIKEQQNYEDFIGFLSQKCGNVEYH